MEKIIVTLNFYWRQSYLVGAEKGVHVKTKYSNVAVATVFVFFT